MVRNVSLFPSGLLGLFGIKNDGVFPGSLGTEYRPSLEMLHWLAGANARELVQESTTAFSTVGLKKGTNSLTRVPAGQAWLVHGSTTSFATTATDFIRGKLVVARWFGNQSLVIRESALNWSSSQEAVGAANPSFTMPGPFVMFPDDEILFWVERIATAGTLSNFFNTWIYRFSL